MRRHLFRRPLHAIGQDHLVLRAIEKQRRHAGRQVDNHIVGLLHDRHDAIDAVDPVRLLYQGVVPHLAQLVPIVGRHHAHALGRHHDPVWPHMRGHPQARTVKPGQRLPPAQPRRRQDQRIGIRRIGVSKRRDRHRPAHALAHHSDLRIGMPLPRDGHSRIEIAPHHIVLGPHHPSRRPPEPALVVRIDRHPLRRPPGAGGFERPRIIVHAVNRDDHHIGLGPIDRRRIRTRIRAARHNPRPRITRPSSYASPCARQINVEPQPRPIERREHIP